MPTYNFQVNGEPVSVDAPADLALLWVLRDKLGITGPKYGCGVNVCKACTCLVNNKAVQTCVTPVSSVASTATGDNNGDYDSLRKRYESLLDRQDQLARAQVVAAGLDPGIFQIVDLPVEPKVPVGPNRWKYRLFGIALALGVAIAVALALEIPKLYSITDDRDVEYYLGVPVIAFIPETSASDERRSPMLALGRTTGALLVVALLTALWLVLTYTKVFSTIASLMR